jgi:3'(2'), 5'-bisphosphate nucleotidase
MFDRPEVQLAMKAVRQASHLAAKVQAEMISPALTKEDRSPVTVADFAVQALVARRLEEGLPDDRLVAEECAGPLREAAGSAQLDRVTWFLRPHLEGVSPEEVCRLIDRGTGAACDRFWTLDPIDGTKGFLRGDQYAVALALIERGEVTIGVLGCPQLIFGGEAGGSDGALVVAVRGAGTWRYPLSGTAEPVRLRVSERTDPATARLLRSYEAGHTSVTDIDRLAGHLGIEAPPVRMDSQAKFAVLAAGEGDVMLRLLSPSRRNYREKIWDQAAGGLVVEQAGGRVTDIVGRPLDFRAGRELTGNVGVVATNGHFHEPVLAALREIGADTGEAEGP